MKNTLAQRNLARPLEKRETESQFNARRAAIPARRANWLLLRQIHAELAPALAMRRALQF